MSKLTLAAGRIDRMLHDPNDHWSDVAIECLTLATAALRHQEHYRWRDLKKETPPNEGYYLIKTDETGGSDNRYWVDHFDGTRFGDKGTSHWAYIPEVKP